MRVWFYSFLVILSFCLSSTVEAKVSTRKFVVVIDAGHGGKDFGAVRGRYQEKDINLGVALKLGEYIENNFPDVRVIYTRKTDVFVELDERAAIANRAKANLFISIHTNSTESSITNASGAETYILGLARSKENLEVAKRENSVIMLEDNYSRRYEGFDPRSPESYIIFEFMTNKYMEQSFEMANYIQGEFKRNTNQSDKGVRQAGFLVLRKTGMPSLLVEVGFVNNPRDGAYLTSSSGQAELGRALYNAFKKYKREFDKKQGILVSRESRDSEDKPFDERIDSNKTQNDNHLVANSRVEKVSNQGQEQDRNSQRSSSVIRGVDYRVQFCVSPKKLSSNSVKFKGLSPVDFYVERGQYKYTYGSSSSMNEILKVQKEVRKLFKDAFIVKFKDGEKIK